MAANNLPIFPHKPVNYRCKLTNHITPRDITTQVPVQLGTAGQHGTLITSMFVRHLGNNTATVLRIYHKNEFETGYSLLFEATLPAIVTGSDTAAVDGVLITLPDMLPAGSKGLHLAPGASLYAGLGTAIASGVQVYAIGGEY